MAVQAQDTAEQAGADDDSRGGTARSKAPAGSQPMPEMARCDLLIEGFPALDAGEHPRRDELGPGPLMAAHSGT